MWDCVCEYTPPNLSTHVFMNMLIYIYIYIYACTNLYSNILQNLHSRTHMPVHIFLNSWNMCCMLTLEHTHMKGIIKNGLNFTLHTVWSNILHKSLKNQFSVLISLELMPMQSRKCETNLKSAVGLELLERSSYKYINMFVLVYLYIRLDF